MIWGDTTLNLPNKLTLFRVCLVPFFIFFLTTNLVNFSAIFGSIIFIVASLTDLLDGYIARKKNIVTDFGKLMDPLADKMLVMSALIIFVSQGLVKDVLVIVIIARDLMIDSIRLLASNKGKVIAADIWGKLKTFFQMVAIIVLLIFKSLKQVTSIENSIENSNEFLSKIKCFGDIFMIISVALTIISAFNYVIKNYKLFKIKR